MFKLTTAKQESGDVEIRLEGRLDDSAVAALSQTLEQIGVHARVTLDLANVTALSDAARRFVSAVRGRGGKIKGGSLYITKLLGEAQS
ncbi:MAG: hypothetical protein KF805_02855 [Phycisphaeraceae bacterium]|nr:hypothetical protein [Phycisphaeraceae bacterium]